MTSDNKIFQSRKCKTRVVIIPLKSADGNEAYIELSFDS